MTNYCTIGDYQLLIASLAIECAIIDDELESRNAQTLGSFAIYCMVLYEEFGDDRLLTKSFEFLDAVIDMVGRDDVPKRRCVLDNYVVCEVMPMNV